MNVKYRQISNRMLFYPVSQFMSFTYNTVTGQAAGIIWDSRHSEIEAGAPAQYIVVNIGPGKIPDDALAAISEKAQ